MDTSQRGIDFIFEFEGTTRGKLADGTYRSYLDTIAKPPVWTVYAGLTKGVTKNTLITKEQGDFMFQKELSVYEDAVESSIGSEKLNQNEFDACVSFTYNCGIGAFKKSIAPLIASGKRNKVPAMMDKYCHAGGKVINGLVRRRKAEAALFLTPVAIDETETEPMPQRVEKVEIPTTVAATEAVKESHSLWSGVAILLSTVWAFFNEVWQWVFGVAKEASTQAVSAKDAVSGLDPMISYFGMNMKGILAAITIAAAMLVIARAISRRK